MRLLRWLFTRRAQEALTDDEIKRSMAPVKSSAVLNCYPRDPSV